jgi:hypothetical protein
MCTLNTPHLVCTFDSHDKGIEIGYAVGGSIDTLAQSSVDTFNSSSADKGIETVASDPTFSAEPAPSPVVRNHMKGIDNANDRSPVEGIDIVRSPVEGIDFPTPPPPNTTAHLSSVDPSTLFPVPPPPNTTAHLKNNNNNNNLFSNNNSGNIAVVDGNSRFGPTAHLNNNSNNNSGNSPLVDGNSRFGPVAHVNSSNSTLNFKISETIHNTVTCQNDKCQMRVFI